MKEEDKIRGNYRSVGKGSISLKWFRGIPWKSGTRTGLETSYTICVTRIAWATPLYSWFKQVHKKNSCFVYTSYSCFSSVFKGDVRRGTSSKSFGMMGKENRKLNLKITQFEGRDDWKGSWVHFKKWISYMNLRVNDLFIFSCLNSLKIDCRHSFFVTNFYLSVSVTMSSSHESSGCVRVFLSQRIMQRIKLSTLSVYFFEGILMVHQSIAQIDWLAVECFGWMFLVDQQQVQRSE